MSFFNDAIALAVFGAGFQTASEGPGTRFDSHDTIDLLHAVYCGPSAPQGWAVTRCLTKRLLPPPARKRTRGVSEGVRPRHWPKASYDPRYDPLVDAGPGHNRDYAPTYWIGTAGPPPQDDGPISGDGRH